MISTWVAICITLAGMAGAVAVHAVFVGRKFGNVEQSLFDTREEVHKVTAEVDRMRDEQKKADRDIADLRVKVAAYTGDSNGGVH